MLVYLLRDRVQDGLDRLGVEHRHDGACWSTRLQTKPGPTGTPGSGTALEGTIHQFQVHILHTSTRRRHRAVRGTISSTFAMLSPPPSISAVRWTGRATTEIHASPLLERVSVCAGNNPLRRARRAGARSVWGLCPSSPLPLPLAPSSSVPARSVVQPGHRSSPMQALLSSVRPSSYTTDRVTGD